MLFYRHHLEQQILPFWRSAADAVYGGVFTGFDNRGEHLLNTDKFTWSQGRYLWLVSRLSEAAANNLLQVSGDYYVDQAEKTAAFLLRNAILDNGYAAFLLSAEGMPKEPSSGSGLATSIYADFNLLVGIAEYARVFRDHKAYNWAWELYRSVNKRITTGIFRCDPYPMPRDLRSHGIAMLQLHSAEQLLRAALALNCAEVAVLTRDCRQQLVDIMANFRQSGGSLREVLGGDGASLLERHCTPGHMLECSWFVLHAAELLGEVECWLEPVLQTVLQAYTLGWDEQYGGLYRFTDCNGGQPCGIASGQAMEELIESTWSLKLWWVHSEALYMTFLAAHVSGQKEYQRLYEKTREYTFRTFPHENAQVAEWIQVRQRDGRPLDIVTSVPGKDPFHIARNLLLIIERVARGE